MDAASVSRNLTLQGCDGISRGSPPAVRLLRGENQIGDGTTIYLVGNAYLLHLSPVAFPEVAEEQRGAIVRAKRVLPADLARHVVDVVDYGRIDGRSWILQPLLTPFSSNRMLAKVQRLCFSPSVLRWLQELAQLSSPTAQAAVEFKLSLRHLADMHNIPPGLRLQAQCALDNVIDRSVRPCFTPMHGDLWRGNILLQSYSDFVVIDWRGSRMDGYGIFDLVRYALSERMGVRSLRRELQAHARALNMDVTQTGIVLLAALGHFARHLGEFPESRFIEMAGACYAIWAGAVG